MRFTLGINKKLKSKKAIEALFVDGFSIRKGALRLKYLPVAQVADNKVAFSVPKRFFKHAVDRNRVKRLLRESYRHQQVELKNERVSCYHLMWIYQSNKLPDLPTIERLMSAICKDLIAKNASPTAEK